MNEIKIYQLDHKTVVAEQNGVSASAPCLKLDHDTHTKLVFDQKRGRWWDTYYLKDYGKTWALTKEELKND